MAVPYTFGSATTSIPLSQLDSNFATTITLGNTAIQLGNTVTTLNNMTLANATVSSGNATVTTLTAPTHNSASSLTFQTNGTTTAMTVDTSQRVIVGYTASVGTAYQTMMQVKGQGSASTYAGYSLTTSNNESAGLFGVYSNAENSLWIASDPDNLRAGSRTVFTVDGTQTAQINPFGIGVGSATPTSGIGITFPATQSASSDANTLDDYEEGTWTPTVAAASVTYTQRFGTYTKIGNVVYINCFVQIATITSPTGGAGSNFISGLPFTSLPSANAYYPNFATSWNGSNFGGTVGMAQMAPSSTSFAAIASTNNAAFTDSSPADIWDSANNWVKITGFYFV